MFWNKYDRLCRKYGIKPMSKTEESNLTAREQMVRKYKYESGVICDKIQMEFDILRDMVRRVPVVNDQETVEGMEAFCSMMKDLYQQINEMSHAN